MNAHYWNPLIGRNLNPLLQLTNENH